MVDLWLKTYEFRDREEILKEFGRRRAIDKLIFCYNLAGWQSGAIGDRKRDRLLILNIFGELKDAKTVGLLTDQLTNPDYSLRTQALDVLGKLKDPATVEVIIPLLYDKDPQIRGKAIHALGESGNGN